MSQIDPLKVLHLSDTHLYGDGSLHYGTVDTRAALDRVLDRAAGLHAIDLVACSGDLSEDGSVESYQFLRAAVEPWAAARGARVIYAMGNHDLRSSFREVLGDGVGGASLPADADAPVYSSTMVGEYRVIVLDSTVPMAGYGHVDAGQLDWLRVQLAQPAPGGTIVVMHHAPVSAETELLGALELQESDEFASVLATGDVRLVLAGHYHHPLIDSVAGIPVVVSTAVANLADTLGDPSTESATRGSGATVLTLSGERGLRVVPFVAAAPDDGEPVFHFDREAVQAIIEKAGPTR